LLTLKIKPLTTLFQRPLIGLNWITEVQYDLFLRQSLKVVCKAYSWMRKIIQVRVYKGEKYYVAECVDLPVVSQGKTLDEAVENIREAISLHLEGEDLSEWDILPDFSILISMEVPPHVEA